MMDKGRHSELDRREKDEGLTYAQDRGRQYGVVGFLVLFLVIMITAWSGAGQLPAFFFIP